MMKSCPSFAMAAFLVVAGFVSAAPASLEQEKARVVVLTDISNEPDDEESLVRFLVYSNQYDVEALIATTSTWLRKDLREDLIRRQIAAYAQVRPRLMKHAPAFPTAEHLAAVTSSGQPEYGLAAVGAGKSTAESDALIAMRAGTVHVILQFEDDGHPRLFAYRRAIVEVIP